MKFKMKIFHKVFLFLTLIICMAISSVIYLNNKYLEEFYAQKRINQILDIREEITSKNSTLEELERYSEKYNVLINKRKNIIKSKLKKVKLNERNEGRRIQKHMGMEQLEFYKLLENGDFITLRISTNSIKTTVEIVNQFFIYSGIAIIIGSFFFIYLFSIRLTKPILTLNSIIKGMVNLDFSYRSNLKSKDELEELGNDINFLAFELEKHMGELTISNKKLTEKVKKIEKIDSLRQEFIASVSHEIKTPITVMNTHAEMLLYDLVETEAERKSYLKTIMAEGENINNLLNELIKLIKLEEKVTDIKEETLDIKSLLIEESSKYAIDLEEKNVDLILNIKEDLFLLGDEFKIRQVLTNIMSNAVSYVEKDGKLILNAFEDQGKGVIEIINTGINIPSEKLEDIWKPFHRIENSRNRKYGGTGLGLAIVSKILERHNSIYGVKNLENKVKFFFTLNLKEGSE